MGAEGGRGAQLDTALGSLAVTREVLGAPGLGDSIWGGLSLIRACSASGPPRSKQRNSSREGGRDGRARKARTAGAEAARRSG